MHKSILTLVFMIFSQIALAQTVDVSGTAICEKEVTFAEKICEHKAYKDAQANCTKQGGHHRFIDRIGDYLGPMRHQLWFAARPVRQQLAIMPRRS